MKSLTSAGNRSSGPPLRTSHFEPTRMRPVENLLVQTAYPSGCFVRSSTSSHCPLASEACPLAPHGRAAASWGFGPGQFLFQRASSALSLVSNRPDIFHEIFSFHHRGSFTRGTCRFILSVVPDSVAPRGGCANIWGSRLHRHSPPTPGKPNPEEKKKRERERDRKAGRTVSAHAVASGCLACESTLSQPQLEAQGSSGKLPLCQEAVIRAHRLDATKLLPRQITQL